MIAAAFFLLGVAVGMALLGACLAWDSKPPQHAARREPLGVRHDRLDAEALRATRPTSSNRKAGRGSL